MNEICLMPENNSDSRFRVIASDEDFEKLAKAIVTQVREQETEFKIEPEKHYNDHRELSKFLKDFDEAKNIFVKFFLSLVFVGSFFLAAFGFWNKG